MFPSYFSLLSPEESEMVVVEVERMLRLAEQCLERAKSFIGKSADPPDLSDSVSAPSVCPLGLSEPCQTASTAPSNTAPNTASNMGKLLFLCQKPHTLQTVHSIGFTNQQSLIQSESNSFLSLCFCSHSCSNRLAHGHRT